MVREQIEAVRNCEHRTQKMWLAAVSAILSAAALRILASIGAALLPHDAWAAELAHEVIRLSGLHYWLAMGFAAVGGTASLFHELRQSIRQFSLTNAVGHMFISQFAGLLAYVGAVGAEWSIPWSLGACGLAGWSGAAAITKASDVLSRRFGVLLGEDRRE